MPLDSALTKYGAFRPGVCTSTTRPASPAVGQAIYETDTFSVRIWDGTGWVGTTPSGAIETFAGATAPNGWLLCFGQAVSRTTYADLFAALSTTHGAGNGSTTFNLPDLRGRVPAGKDNMGGTSANRLITNVAGGTLGASGGAESHTLTAAQSGSPSHVHRENGNSWVDAYGSRFINPSTSGSNWFNTESIGLRGAVYTYGSDAINASSGHNNTQPTIVLNYIIKV